MKKYNKPTCVSNERTNGLVPALAAAGLSVGGAALVGAAAGLMSKGGDDKVIHCRKLQECIVTK